MNVRKHSYTIQERSKIVEDSRMFLIELVKKKGGEDNERKRT